MDDAGEARTMCVRWSKTGDMAVGGDGGHGESVRRQGMGSAGEMTGRLTSRGRSQTGGGPTLSARGEEGLSLDRRSTIGRLTVTGAIGRSDRPTRSQPQISTWTAPGERVRCDAVGRVRPSPRSGSNQMNSEH